MHLLFILLIIFAAVLFIVQLPFRIVQQILKGNKAAMFAGIALLFMVSVLLMIKSI